MKTTRILKYESLKKASWLELQKIHYKDKSQHIRTWETVKRLRSSGAVVMPALLKPSNRLILIKQYRPPADQTVIEFPAGLMDKEGEAPEETAVRELLEETGYTGKVVETWPPSYSSPGLTSETVTMCIMEVDENAPENIDVKPELEAGEEIETVLVDINNLQSFLRKAYAEGYSVDSKVLSFSISSTAGRNT